MISRELHRPLWEPLHRDLDRTREGIGGGEGVTLILTAPDGAYAGAQAVVTGGTPIVYVDGEYAPITAGVGETIIPYMFIINGVETGEWFESPTTFPLDLAEGDEVRVKDALDNLSNILTAVWDPDAEAFFIETEATDTANINHFFAGLKKIGIWGESVFWMMRDSQNYGSGTSVKSAGGESPHDGVIDVGYSGGPSYQWTSDGVDIDTVSGSAYARISIPTLFQVFDQDHSYIGISSLRATTSTQRRLIGSLMLPATELNIITGSSNTNSSRVGTWSEGIYSEAVFSSLDVSVVTAHGVVFDYASSQAKYFRNGIFNDQSRASSNPGLRSFDIGGGQGTADCWDGVHSFALRSSAILSESQMLALYDLYKETIGFGLPLP